MNIINAINERLYKIFVWLGLPLCNAILGSILACGICLVLESRRMFEGPAPLIVPCVSMLVVLAILRPYCDRQDREEKEKYQVRKQRLLDQAKRDGLLDCVTSGRLFPVENMDGSVSYKINTDSKFSGIEANKLKTSIGL